VLQCARQRAAAACGSAEGAAMRQQSAVVR
jgi:hypothetical protein